MIPIGMKWRILTGAIFTLTLVELASPGLTSAAGLHFISQMSGDVKLKQVGWSNYQKANFGDLLSQEDQLQLGAKASATVFCSNLRLWKVPSAKVSRVSEGCPSGTATLNRPNSSRTATRAPNSTIPYIISPRDTALLNDQPILRWNAVPGATRYTVQVRGGDLDWETETSGTEIVYPGAPPLKKGRRYRLIVVANNGASSEEEEGVSLRFSVLDDQKAELVLAKVRELKQQRLTKEAEGLALAYLYRSHELNAEAIELLEGLVKQGSQITAVYQLLGDIYLQVGLSRLAKGRYLTALQLAKRSEDVEGQAVVQAGLGEADDALGNKNEAVRWLENAKAGYVALGDDLQLRELERRIDSLLGK